MDDHLTLSVVFLGSLYLKGSSMKRKLERVSWHALLAIRMYSNNKLGPFVKGFFFIMKEKTVSWNYITSGQVEVELDLPFGKFSWKFFSNTEK
jgi:hypothetical protein